MPEPASRVVLVGFMGTGKSTVGRLVARRLGYRFEDMDQRIEARTGRRIATIFSEDGEESFRSMESDEAQALGETSRVVIAAGGGAFARPATRALLQRGAVTVWLRCDFATLCARIPDDGVRPLAANRDIMRSLLAEREASYRMADVAVDAVGTPDEVADRVIALVRGRLQDATSPGR